MKLRPSEKKLFRKLFEKAGYKVHFTTTGMVLRHGDSIREILNEDLERESRIIRYMSSSE